MMTVLSLWIGDGHDDHDDEEEGEDDADVGDDNDDEEEDDDDEGDDEDCVDFTGSDWSFSILDSIFQSSSFYLSSQTFL